MFYPRPRHLHRRLLATAAAVAVGATLPGVASANDARSVPDTPGQQRPATQAGPFHQGAAVSADQVTLVTGDVVTLTTGADGKQTVEVAAADGTARTFQTVTEGDGDTFVYPTDALAGIAAKTVDRNLFNVTRLIQDGYGDDRTDQLPVLVSYADGPGVAALNQRVQALPASEAGAVLNRLDMAGLSVAKDGASAFWKAARPADTARGRATTAARDDVSRIWYDAPVKAALDTSVPQINAPEAWEAGYDGTGVRVAVLDTGIDMNHPDVKGKVVGSRSFVSDTVQDGHGHGTHVASTIAGSGAASGGRYKGVAPGAELVIGKVLNDGGSGPLSGIIAGMEWAVDQDADIVNLSLGAPHDPTFDPGAAAVDRLSAASGTLFVIAAGNEGPDESTIGSPGTADSALTVGAVDTSDALASFSSRGPRLGDHGIKPDVTAPGVNIAAARASGTAMGTVVDEYYTSAGGTSMATPHVAGAAALLAQRHPDWNGTQIKSALVSRAVPSDVLDVYQQGSGRIDVARALDPAVTVSGAADYGLILYQEAPYDRMTRKVTVNNPTDTATTVTLTADVRGTLPADALTLPEREVEVPARGSVEVPVVLDPNGVAEGRYHGGVTATTTDGATAHTALGFIVEGPRYNVTVTVTGRDGAPAARGSIVLSGMGANDTVETRELSGGRATIRVPQGSFGLQGSFVTYGKGTADSQDVFVRSDVTVTDRDVQVEVDGTRARDVEVDVTDERRPLEKSSFSYNTAVVDGEGEAVTASLTGGMDSANTRFGLVPSAKPAVGDLWASFYLRQREPLVRAGVEGRNGFEMTAKTHQNLSRFAGTRRLSLVDVGGGSPEELEGRSVRGRAALLRVPYLNGASTQLRALEEAGASVVILATTKEGPASLYTDRKRVPQFAVTYRDGARLAERAAAGPVTVVVRGVEESTYTYSGQYELRGDLTVNPRFGTRVRDYATLRNTANGNGNMAGYLQMSGTDAPVGAVRMYEFLKRGEQRDDRVYAREGAWYSQRVMPDWEFGSQRMQEPDRTYRPGTTVTGTWFAPAMRLTDNGPYACGLCRTDTGQIFAPSYGGDSDPSHYTTGIPDFVGTFIRDGVQYDDAAQWWVDKPANYRIRYDVAWPEGSGVDFGRTSQTEFAFRSQAPTGMLRGCEEMDPEATACAALPLVTTDYSVEVDALNRAPAGRQYRFTLDAGHARGWHGRAAIAGARVSVSFDDGATWSSAGVRRSGRDSFVVSYKHPKLAASNGYVSVRTEVWDDQGSRTTERIDRMYALR